MIKDFVVKWAKLGRVPFHSVGVLPFLLGNVLAWRLEGEINVPVLVLGLTAVVLIMLTTYLNGEVFDRTEDRITQTTFKNPFSGGSGLAVEGKLRRTVVLVSIGSIVGAGLIGLVLQFGLGTGVWTIPLGLTGMVAGALYSVPPVRWASRGIGEILIGYCYGWLTVATGYYLQAGRIAFVVLPIAGATACTIFNVILMNEYPDYEGDRAAGKRNMAVRFGLEKAAWVYAAVAGAGVVLALISAVRFFPSFTWKAYLPVGVLSLVASVTIVRKGYRRRNIVLALCGATIFVNLATTAVFIAGALAL
jgi:1,4-dihydroxy-2-naphthoate octaprenyltransferase